MENRSEIVRMKRNKSNNSGGSRRGISNITIILELSFLAIILCLFFSYREIPCQEDIYGVWGGEHHGKELIIRFSNDGTCVLSFMDKRSDSLDILKGNFEINFSKAPLPLTIRNIQELNHPLHTIIEFAGNNSARIAEFATCWRLRPISFDQDTSIILERRG